LYEVKRERRIISPPKPVITPSGVFPGVDRNHENNSPIINHQKRGYREKEESLESERTA
jgi:hypothetical protein